MLKKFSVTNFKGFKEKMTLELSKPGNYEFNKEVVVDGCVTKGLIYGINGSGKSNLGLAIFDIIFNLTDKEKLGTSYRNYRNLENNLKEVEFEFVFQFGDSELKYIYTKENVEKIIHEELLINGETVILYNYIEKDGFTKLSGSETLNSSMKNDNSISRVRYVANNSILVEDEKNKVFTDFINFVDRMLLFYSLDERGYEGLQVGSQRISEGIIERGKLKDFQKFLNENDVNYQLKEIWIDGQPMIYCIFDKASAEFFSIASTGTKSLAVFYYWYIRMREASFVFIDEFDAFYHFQVAENIVKKLRGIEGVQVFLTTHNTDLLSNDLLRPDCYFLMENNEIQPLAVKTDKELRKAHNLQKMFKAGAFDEKEL